MDIIEIRRRTAYDPNEKPSLKTAVSAWGYQLSKEFQFGVTITIKQSYKILNNRGCYIHSLKREDCDAIAYRFIQKLNRQVFGKAAERYNKSLKFLFVVEGERSGKNLHFHIAIGNYPSSRSFNKFPTMIINAIEKVNELDFEHNVSIMDSGWVDYFSKETGRHDTDNVLWHLT
jgi:hypothetical protein